MCVRGLSCSETSQSHSLLGLQLGFKPEFRTECLKSRVRVLVLFYRVPVSAPSVCVCVLLPCTAQRVKIRESNKYIFERRARLRVDEDEDFLEEGQEETAAAAEEEEEHEAAAEERRAAAAAGAEGAAAADEEEEDACWYRGNRG
jgi:hypothetical protein